MIRRLRNSIILEILYKIQTLHTDVLVLRRHVDFSILFRSPVNLPMRKLAAKLLRQCACRQIGMLTKSSKSA